MNSIEHLQNTLIFYFNELKPMHCAMMSNILQGKKINFPIERYIFF